MKQFIISIILTFINIILKQFINLLKQFIIQRSNLLFLSNLLQTDIL